MGGLATDGFEVMAKTDGTGPLRAEIEASIASDTAASLLIGSGIPTGDGATRFESELAADDDVQAAVSEAVGGPVMGRGTRSPT